MKFKHFVKNTQRIITASQFKKFKLTLHQKRRTNDLLHKIMFCKKLKAFYVKTLIKENAKQIITNEREKKDKDEATKKDNNMIKI
jgi:hypothetical protein